MTLTNQEIFNKALQGIRSQNYQPSMEGQACMYNGGDGVACAVGHCVSLDTRKAWDQMFNKPLCPGTGISSIYIHSREEYLKYFTREQLEFLTELQHAHDHVLRNHSADVFEQEMKHLSLKYDLEYTKP